MNSAQRAASRDSSLGALGCLDEAPQIPAGTSEKPSVVMAKDHLLRHRAEWKKEERSGVQMRGTSVSARGGFSHCIRASLTGWDGQRVQGPPTTVSQC